MFRTLAPRRVVNAVVVSALTIAALLLMKGFFVSSAQKRSNKENATALVPGISATNAVTFAPGGDADSDNKADPGDILQYTVTVTNSGTDATGVQLSSTLQNITTYAPGSLAVSPIAFNDSYTAVRNTQLSVAASGVLSNDNPGQNPVGTITAFDTSSTQCAFCGNVAVNANGSFTYMPPAGFTGTDTFTYTRSNAAGSSTGTVTVQVTLPPPPPAAMNDGFNNPDPPLETPANTSLDTGLLAPPFTVLNNDTLNGGTLAFFGATGPTANTVVNGTNTAATQQGGTLLLRPDGTFVYTPAPGFSGFDGFFYKLQNASGTSQAQVRVQVTGPTSSAPVAAHDNYSTAQNQQFSRPAPGFLGNDAINGATIQSHTNPTNGTLTAFGTDGSFTYTPNPGSSGNDSFTYTLQNAAGSSTATVTIYVDVLPSITSTVPASAAPCVPLNSAITLNFSEMVTTSGAFSISPSIAFNQSPTDGNVTSSFVLTPNANLTPGVQYTVSMNRFQVADLDGGLSPAANHSFSFTATPVPSAVNDGVNNPDPPLETPMNTSIDTALLPTPYTILNNDGLLCGATLAFFGATGPSANTIVNGTNTAATQQAGTVRLRPDGTFLYTPAMGFTGLDGFFYKLQNGSGTSQAQVRIRVVSTPLASSIVGASKLRFFPFPDVSADPKAANAAAESIDIHTERIEVNTPNSQPLSAAASFFYRIAGMISPRAHAQDRLPESGENITTTPAFTLPAGKSVKIVYRAVVDSGPFPGGVTNVTNQARIFGTNFTDVTTNTASIALDAAPPTAASVQVAGRVLTIDGRGIGGARVVMEDGNGAVTQARTNPFGYYSFGDVQAGRTYSISVVDKRFIFATRIITVQDELTDLDLTGVPREE